MQVDSYRASLNTHARTHAWYVSRHLLTHPARPILPFYRSTDQGDVSRSPVTGKTERQRCIKPNPPTLLMIIIARDPLTREKTLAPWPTYPRPPPFELEGGGGDCRTPLSGGSSITLSPQMGLLFHLVCCLIERWRFDHPDHERERRRTKTNEAERKRGCSVD